MPKRRLRALVAGLSITTQRARQDTATIPIKAVASKMMIPLPLMEPGSPEARLVVLADFSFRRSFGCTNQLAVLLMGLARQSESRTNRRIKEIGRRAYALELVKQHQARVEARAEPTQYLYPSQRAVRTKIDPISEAARRNGVARKLDQYSWLTYRRSKSQLWAMHPRDPANLRTAGESRRWQERDWEAESGKQTHVKQTDRRRNAPTDIRSSGGRRTSDRSGSATRPHQPKLHLPARAG